MLDNPREVELGAKLHIEGECCQSFVCRICGAVRHEEGLSPRAIVTICEKCPSEEEHWAPRGLHVLDGKGRVIGKRELPYTVDWHDWVNRLAEAIRPLVAEASGQVHPPASTTTVGVTSIWLDSSELLKQIDHLGENK